MTTETDRIKAGTFAGFLVWPVGIALMMLNTWVMQVLWNWFAVPLGVTTLTFAHAFGLRLLSARLIGSKSRCKDERTTVQKWKDLFFDLVFAPLVSLGIGWFVFQFYGGAK